MSTRILRSMLALGALLALTAALAGGAFADGSGGGKPGGVNVDKPGSGKKPYSLTKIKTKSGTTTLTIESGLKTTLDGLGITVSGAPPAGGNVDFPITKARVIVKKPKKGKGKGGKKKIAGFVNHSGGLKFERTGYAGTTLWNLRIDFSAGRSGALSGSVNGAKDRVRLGTLSDVAYDSVSKDIMVGKVTLTKKAADTLNAALGTTLSKTTVLGALKVDTTP